MVKLRKIRLLRLLINTGTTGRYKKEEEFSMSDYLIRYMLTTEFDSALTKIDEVLQT